MGGFMGSSCLIILSAIIGAKVVLEIDCCDQALGELKRTVTEPSQVADVCQRFKNVTSWTYTYPDATGSTTSYTDRLLKTKIDQKQMLTMAQGADLYAQGAHDCAFCWPACIFFDCLTLHLCVALLRPGSVSRDHPYG